jgi:hypothetical protein
LDDEKIKKDLGCLQILLIYKKEFSNLNQFINKGIIKMKKKKSNKYRFEELTAAELEEKDMQLFDQADKPFLTLYLFIFILGILLTIISI